MPGPDERHGQPGSPALVTRSAGINQTLASDRLLDSLLRRLPVVVGVGPVDVVEQVVLETNHTGNHVNEVQEDLDLGVAASRVLLLNDAANPCNVSSSVDPAEALAANGLFRGVEIVRGLQSPVMCVRVMCTCAPYWKTPSGAGKSVASSALVYATQRGGHRAGVASMAWRTTRRFSTNAP